MQMHTEAFQRWFSGSTVLDREGAPLVVYHGTRFDFTVFDAPSDEHFAPSAVQLLGHWFASTQKAARRFSRRRDLDGEGRARIIEAYLCLRAPLVIEGGWDGLAKAAWGNSYSDRAVFDWRQRLIDRGIDGIVLKDSRTDGGGSRTDYVVFRPGQIKSATSNSGAFDPDDPDITR